LVKFSKRTGNLFSVAYVSLSLFGLVILAISTFTFQVSQSTFALQKQLIGSIFASICFFGMVAAYFPSKCSWTPHFRNQEKVYQEESGKETAPIEFVGHHPTCGNFSSHILIFRGKAYCAGCTGLISGAGISLLGTLSYSVFNLNLGNGTLVFWVGFTAVACGLLQYSIPYGDMGVVHMFLNVVFVFGPFLLLVGVNEVTGNLILELYLLALIIYWIISRIVVSQIRHREICAACAKSCGF
jgi:hypothetical protein